MIPKYHRKRKLKVNCFSKKGIIFWRDMMSQEKFLRQLNYWITQGEYGVEHNGKIWIYNTLDDWAKQLGVSKRTIQRIIKALRDDGFIEATYLSDNKRDRTLFYTINYEKFNARKLLKHQAVLKKNGHIVDHMVYIDNNNKNFDKSYKSPDSEISKKSSKASVQAEKPTIVQDMLNEFKKEFPEVPVFLTRLLARNLVAAFKIKFQNSLNEWKKFLRLIKTSAYLMGERFKLTIHWILKFVTIDRLRQGDLGVKLDQVIENPDETKQQIQQNIEQLKESQLCKNKRIEMLHIVEINKYTKYLSNINKCRFVEENGEVIAEFLGQPDFDMQIFLESIDLKNRWISDYAIIRQDGHDFYKTFSSFEELELAC